MFLCILPPLPQPIAYSSCRKKKVICAYEYPSYHSVQILVKNPKVRTLCWRTIMNLLHFSSTRMVRILHHYLHHKNREKWTAKQGWIYMLTFTLGTFSLLRALLYINPKSFILYVICLTLHYDVNEYCSHWWQTWLLAKKLWRHSSLKKKRDIGHFWFCLL